MIFSFQCNLEKDDLSAEMVGEHRVLWLRLSELVSGMGTFQPIAGSLCVVTIHLSLGVLCDMNGEASFRFDLDLLLF